MESIIWRQSQLFLSDQQHPVLLDSQLSVLIYIHFHEFEFHARGLILIVLVNQMFYEIAFVFWVGDDSIMVCINMPEVMFGVELLPIAILYFHMLLIFGLRVRLLRVRRCKKES